MRKALVVIVVLFVATLYGLAYADQSTVSPAGYTYPPAGFSGVVTMSGKPGVTKNIAIVDNVATSLLTAMGTAGGAVMGGTGATLTPIGAVVSCVDNTTHWTFGGTTPTASVGHALTAGTWLHLTNPEAVATAKAFGYTGGAVTCTLTLEY